MQYEQYGLIVKTVISLSLNTHTIKKIHMQLDLMFPKMKEIIKNKKKISFKRSLSAREPTT